MYLSHSCDKLKTCPSPTPAPKRHRRGPRTRKWRSKQTLIQLSPTSSTKSGDQSVETQNTQHAFALLTVRQSLAFTIPLFRKYDWCYKPLLTNLLLPLKPKMVFGHAPTLYIISSAASVLAPSFLISFHAWSSHCSLSLPKDLRRWSFHLIPVWPFFGFPS